MGSKKGSARAKQTAAFKSQLGGMDDLFAREEHRAREAAGQHEKALRDKACASKNRYSSRSEAEAAIAWCAEQGRTGLHVYRCEYCNGWHLTSKPPRK